MTGGGFPTVKLTLQLFRQITKPLSTSIINFAKQHPRFRQHFLVTPGQYYHWWDSVAKTYLQSDKFNTTRSNRTITKAKKIDESKAMEVGAQLMIETLVFFILATFVVYESSKSVASSQLLEDAREQDLAAMVGRKNDLSLRLEHQAALIQELRSRIHDYSSGVVYPLPRLSETPEESNYPNSGNSA